jgi:hypothetical protein
MEHSRAVRERYGGKVDGTNFRGREWYTEGGEARDPYEALRDGAGDGGVADGAGAARAYGEVRRGEADRGKTEEVLRKYCEVDTLAMDVVHTALRGFVEEAQREEAEEAVIS